MGGSQGSVDGFHDPLLYSSPRPRGEVGWGASGLRVYFPAPASGTWPSTERRAWAAPISPADS